METQAIVSQEKIITLSDFNGDKKKWLEQNNEALNTLKRQHPQGIFALFQKSGVAVFKKPSRAEMNFALSKADKDATLDMFEALAEACFIAGDEGLLKNDERFFGAVTQFKEIIEGEKTELVNL